LISINDDISRHLHHYVFDKSQDLIKDTNEKFGALFQELNKQRNDIDELKKDLSSTLLKLDMASKLNASKERFNQDNITNLKEIGMNISRELIESYDRIEELSKIVKVSEREIERMSSKIDELNRTLKERKSEIERMSYQIEELDKSSIDKDNQNQIIQRNMNTVSDENTTLKVEINKCNNYLIK
jgi:chromosome segregation ATPase